MSDEVISQQALELFLRSIAGTFFQDILESVNVGHIAPMMPIGPEPDNKIVGEMTELEKQLFSRYVLLHQDHKRFLYEERERILDSQKENAQTVLRLELGYATDQEVREKKIFRELKKTACDDLFRLTNQTKLDMIEVIKGLLRELILSRLELTRGLNVRYYLAEGFKIVAESGIVDKNSEPPITAEEVKVLMSLDNVGRNVYKGPSAIIERICVLC